MTLLVRDEQDILEANLEHHFAQGVDFVIATDNGSVDGTVDILRRYEQDGHLRIIFEPTDTYDQHIWVTRMARLAASDHHADWVLNNDADEFWFPTASDDLRSALATVPPDVGAVAAQRYNHVPRPDDGRAPLERMTVRQTASINEIGRVLHPKLVHRGDPAVVVRQGNHEIESDTLGGVLDDGRIEILHFPLRTYEQFENKVRRGGAAYERNTDLPQAVGQRWRTWYRQWQDGELGAEWDRFVYDEARVTEGLADGSLTWDRRLGGPSS